MGKLVLLILLGFSVASWAIIIHKWRLMRRIRRETYCFVKSLPRVTISQSCTAATKQYQASPLARMFAAGYAELRTYLAANWLAEDAMVCPMNCMRKRSKSLRVFDAGRFQRMLSLIASEETIRLERLLPFLATTGSATRSSDSSEPSGV